MSECVRIIQNSCHRFKVQTLLQPSKCLLGLLLSKGGIDTVEQAPSPEVFLNLFFHMNLMLRRSTSPTSGRCPLHGISCDAHEQFWQGWGPFPLGYHNLNGVGWVLSCFDFNRSCIESWAHSCARRRETSLTRSSTEWMQAPWLLPVVLEQRAVGHEFAPRWWARNGPASVPASACLHPAWFVFVLGVLVTSRDHWWNTVSVLPKLRSHRSGSNRSTPKGMNCVGFVVDVMGWLRHVTACYGFVSFFSRSITARIQFCSLQFF